MCFSGLTFPVLEKPESCLAPHPIRSTCARVQVTGGLVASVMVTSRFCILRVSAQTCQPQVACTPRPCPRYLQKLPAARRPAEGGFVGTGTLTAWLVTESAVAGVA